MAAAAVIARALRKAPRAPEVPAPARNPAAAIERSGRLTVEDHWQRAAGLVLAESERAETMCKFQRSASAHLDAADYALQQLMAELKPVMPVAERKSNVHRLPQGPARGGPATKNAEAA